MFKRNREKARSRGAALIVTLIIAFVLVGLGLLILFLTDVERFMTNQLVAERQAFNFSDVEVAYISIGQKVIGLYNNWTDVLSDGSGGSCSRNTPPTNPQGCVDEIPAANDLDSLKGPWCKGRILRLPSSFTVDLSNPQANPFRVACQPMPDGSQGFCRCRMADLNGRLLPFETTLYVRNDPQDISVIEDDNGEITLIAVTQSLTRAQSRTIMAYALSAWEQEAKLYDTWQTGASEK